MAGCRFRPDMCLELHRIVDMSSLAEVDGCRWHLRHAWLLKPCHAAAPGSTQAAFGVLMQLAGRQVLNDSKAHFLCATGCCICCCPAR